jgi:hypothetical protein
VIYTILAYLPDDALSTDPRLTPSGRLVEPHICTSGAMHVFIEFKLLRNVGNFGRKLQPSIQKKTYKNIMLSETPNYGVTVL